MVRSRPDITHRAELDAFLGWLLGSSTQSATTLGSGRSFRRRTTWCWRVEPVLPVTGEVFDEVQVDGMYLRTDWCILIATVRGKVIAWQWCDREKTAAWTALLNQFPPPRVVVCDGGTGLLQAIADSWKSTRVQRCLVHVQRNMRTYLTMKPRTDAGRSLWALARGLTRVKTTEQADAWLHRLNDWYSVFGELTKQRTYANQLGTGGTMPDWVKPGQRWWYTHDRLRRAYRLLAKLVQREQLFTYLRPEFAGLDISSSTNWIEGGTNAMLRDLLHRHRGMSEEHQRRAIEWWLLHHGAVDINPHDLVRPEHLQPPTKPKPLDEPDGPALYDTGLTAEEGLWHRRGWAGRS